MDVWRDGRMDEWMDGRMQGWKDSEMEGWMDGEMHGCMDSLDFGWDIGWTTFAAWIAWMDEFHYRDGSLLL
eukprot:10878583-Karenia_brevis.AAC.1